MVIALLTKNHPRGWIVPHFDTVLVCQKLLLIARWLNSVIFCWFRFVLRVQVSEVFLSGIWCCVLDVWSVTSASLHSPTWLASSHRCLQHCFLWSSSPSWLIEYRAEQLWANSFISFVSDLICSPRQWFGDVCLHWNCYWIGTCLLGD